MPEGQIAKAPDVVEFENRWKFHTEQHIAFIEFRFGRMHALVYAEALMLAAMKYINDFAPHMAAPVLRNLSSIQPGTKQ